MSYRRAKWSGVVAVFFTAAALSVTCASAQTRAESGPTAHSSISLRFADDFPTTAQPLNLAYQRWATNTIERVSKGEIKVSFYPGATLYKGADAAQALSNGTLDMAAISTPTLTGLFPEFNVLSLPFMAPTVSQSLRLASPGSPLFNFLAKRVAANGITLLPVGLWDPGSLGMIIKTSNPIGFDDLDGLKIRTVGSAVQDSILKALGASPIAMSPTDVPTAMATGALDGAVGSTNFFNGPLISIGHGFLDGGVLFTTGYYVFVSTQRWHEVPASDRKLIVKTLQSLWRGWQKQLPRENNFAFNALKKHGAWIHELTPKEEKVVTAKLRGIWTSYNRSDDSGAYQTLLKARKKLFKLTGLPK